MSILNDIAFPLDEDRQLNHFFKLPFHATICIIFMLKLMTCIFK